MNKLNEFEKNIGIKFKNIKLLKIAFTHTSYSAEHLIDKKNVQLLSSMSAVHFGNFDNNERLEFLGDSVLSLVVSTYLYKKYPYWREGQLTKYRAKLISKDSCYNWAKTINIGDYLLLGIGEEKNAGRKKVSNLANAFEALIGAIYLDRGFNYLKKFLVSFFENVNIDYFLDLDVDYKSKLQETVQKKYKIAPVYEIISEEGPAHNKTFIIQVKIKDIVLGTGRGNNKRQAEQLAAKDVLMANKL
ncbi:MAG: ribonuclease III [Elusimicrobiota bacterium]|jgi:ribonuclease-3|nr:ribonuclease III [Elusimicrobiota bacterium]